MKEIQLGKPWVGPTYEQTLDKIDASQVFRRPLDNLHSVADKPTFESHTGQRLICLHSAR